MGGIYFNVGTPTEVGLLGYWKMDASGATIVDESGNGNHLTVGGSPSVVSGQVDNALQLGTGDQLYRTDNLSVTDDMAVSFYVKFNSLGTDSAYYSLFTLGQGMTGNNRGIGFIRTFGAARIHVSKWNGANHSIHQYNSAVNGHTPSTGVWYHYFLQPAAVPNTMNSGGNFQHWVDGIKILDTGFSVFGADNFDRELFIEGADTQFDITMDQLKIYDISSRGIFNQSEIEQLRDAT